MKSVFIDTNMPNADGSYFLHELTVRMLRLSPGDPVTAYQDQEAWTGTVVCTDGTWGVALSSEAAPISAERYEGQQEGYLHGRQIQSLALLRILGNLNAPGELIDAVKGELERLG